MTGAIGTERLLAVDQHVGRDVGEQRGGVEAAGVEAVGGEALAAGDEARALVERVGDLPLHLGQRGGVDQRADGDAVGEAAARLQLGEALLHGGDELLGDAALHEHAVRADARLPGVEELHRRRALGRVHRVGVVEDDERRVAAELHAHALHAGRGLLRDELAHLGGAGEGDLAHERVRHQLVADGLRAARW